MQNLHSGIELQIRCQDCLFLTKIIKRIVALWQNLFLTTVQSVVTITIVMMVTTMSFEKDVDLNWMHLQVRCHTIIGWVYNECYHHLVWQIMNIYLLEFVYYKYTLMHQPLHPSYRPKLHLWCQAMLPEQIVEKNNNRLVSLRWL